INTMHPKILISLLTALVATSSAIPTNNEAEPLDIEKRACSKKVDWQAGGCETDWDEHCYDKCYTQGAKKKCCMNSIDSDITSQHCFIGWNTCECSCMT
ncbi:hypothetical protein K469DRAFT_607104, partial [Zopfia rhizophila CBS 207.26]